MPRDGSGVYSLPPGISGVPNATIESTDWNTYTADAEQDANAVRPIIAGGTGANNATAARINLQTEVAKQVVTNFDSHVWESGSFYAHGTATGSPVPGAGFSGTAIVVDANYITVEARNLNDPNAPKRVYVRSKSGGVWGPWLPQGTTSIIGDSDGIAGALGDMWYGIRGTAPAARFAVHNKADLTGVDVFAVGAKGLAVISGLGQTAANFNPALAGNNGGSLFIQDIGSTAGNGGMIVFGAQQGYFAGIKGLLSNGSVNTQGHITFSTRAAPGDAALTERLRIADGGNVTVGNGHLIVNGDGVTTDLRFNTSRGDGRNYAFRQSQTAAGDLVLMQSTAAGGDAMVGRQVFSIGILGGFTVTNGLLVATGGATIRAATDADFCLSMGTASNARISFKGDAGAGIGSHMFHNTGNGYTHDVSSGGPHRWAQNGVVQMTLPPSGALSVSNGIVSGSWFSAATYFQSSSGQFVWGPAANCYADFSNTLNFRDTAAGYIARLTLTSGNATVGAGTQPVSITVNSNGQGVFNIQNAGSQVVAFGTELGVQGSGSATKNTLYSTTATYRLYGLGAGAVQSDGAGNLSVTSDARLKDDLGLFTDTIRDHIDVDGALISQPKFFKWKPEAEMDDGEYVGFFAQDYERGTPEAVGQDGRGMKTFSDRVALAVLHNTAFAHENRLARIEQQLGIV